MNESAKEKRRASTPFLNIGTSSFLVVFLVLCLVTFAILALTTAQSDRNLTEKAAARKDLYYSAVNASEEKLAELDEMLAESYANTADYNSYRALLSLTLPEAGYTFWEEDGRMLVSFTREMTDRQSLVVSVVLTDPWSGDADCFYRLNSRIVKDLAVWEGEETITLMDF